MIKAENKHLTLFLVLLSVLYAAAFFYLHLLSPGVEGGMDSYQHYLIARYSWKYPDLFLHQWGKPLFTLFASVFAQFGLHGMVALNLLCIISSAWLVYFSAKNLKIWGAAFAFLSVLFSPIFMDQLISGLTEPFCALCLSLIIYFFTANKPVVAAVVAGLIPFARSEGFMIMAVAGFYLLFVLKNYRAFLWLLAGSLFFNTLGWIIEGKPLWIFTENPYIRVELEKVNICGKGGISHYLRAVPITFGYTTGLLTFGSILVLLIKMFMSPKSMFRQNKNSMMFWMVAGTFVLYFMVHSLIWYLGKMGSCGYIRVMAVIAPASGLLSADFLHRIYELIKVKWTRWFQGILVAVSLFMIAEPFWRYSYKYPLQISDEQKVFTQVADWLKIQDLNNRMVYFLYPYLNILADIDPWDTQHFAEIWGFHFDYAPVGSLIIWDGHFGPNEGRLPLDSLRQHPDFKEVKSFIPEKPFKTLNNYDFEVHIFERFQKK